MIGIKSYGTYIPWYRINRKIIKSSMGWLEQTTPLSGEKAVGNFDEDSITMSVAACRECLNGVDKEKIDYLCFATDTPPFEKRQNAGIIATALGLSSDIRTADFTGSLKSGTTALLSAYSSVKGGSANDVLVCASGRCAGKPGGPQEMLYGDASAAFILSEENVAAGIEGFNSVSYDFMDHWRARKDNFDSGWEDRWIREEGYGTFINEAFSKLAEKYELEPEDIAKAVYPCLNARVHQKIGRKFGLEPDQIQDHIIGKIGNTGAAYPLIMLVGALEEAEADEKIIVASYGSGSDSIYLKTTNELKNLQDKSRGIEESLEAKKNIENYEKYLSFYELIPKEEGIRGEQTPPVPPSVVWRNKESMIALTGSKCKDCGTPQFPPQRVCINPECGSIDNMEDHDFSDKKGTIFTYTEDHLAHSPLPPLIYGMIDFDGGGRFLFEITDCEPGMLERGTPVEMVFRKKYLGKTTIYFWKATPSTYEEVIEE